MEHYVGLKSAVGLLMCRPFFASWPSLGPLFLPRQCSCPLHPETLSCWWVCTAHPACQRGPQPGTTAGLVRGVPVGGCRPARPPGLQLPLLCSLPLYPACTPDLPPRTRALCWLAPYLSLWLSFAGRRCASGPFPSPQLPGTCLCVTPARRTWQKAGCARKAWAAG